MTHLFVQGRFLEVVKFSGNFSNQHWVSTLPTGEKSINASPIISDSLTILMLLTVGIVSAVSYAIVEKPTRAWSRRLSTRWWRVDPASDLKHSAVVPAVVDVRSPELLNMSTDATRLENTHDS